MAQELTTFADRPALSPKHSKFFEENKNIQDRQTVPSISYEGKKWTIVLNGEKHIVQKKDSDGDLVPVTTLKVVVLDQNPVRGRAYYEGAYNPETVTMPRCWSDDSVTPSKFVKEPVRRTARRARCPPRGLARATIRPRRTWSRARSISSSRSCRHSISIMNRFA